MTEQFESENKIGMGRKKGTWPLPNIYEKGGIPIYWAEAEKSSKHSNLLSRMIVDMGQQSASVSLTKGHTAFQVEAHSYSESHFKSCRDTLSNIVHQKLCISPNVGIKMHKLVQCLQYRSSPSFDHMNQSLNSQWKRVPKTNFN